MRKAWICAAVCATLKCQSNILCQNNNLCLQEVLCSTYCWCLISKTFDFFSLLWIWWLWWVFSTAVCVTLFLGRQQRQVENQLGPCFIEISFALHCVTAFLWAPVCSHTSCSQSLLLFPVLANNETCCIKWKTQISFLLRTNLLFPSIELLCGWF